MAEIANIIGMIGVVLMLLAFLLLQMGKLSSHHLGYSVLNFIGALMLLYSLLFAWNLPAVVIEGSWALISLYGIVRIYWRRR